VDIQSCSIEPSKNSIFVSLPAHRLAVADVAPAKAERAKARGVKMGRKPKLTDRQKRKAIKRRVHGEQTLAEIGRSYNVSGWTISRLWA
jgi:hypothetical protein